MNRQPTEEQNKEFWKWYGQYKECGYCRGTGRIYINPFVYHQCNACNGNGGFKPPIDLNELFRLAVPEVLKDYRLTIETDLDNYTATFSDDPLHINSQVTDKDLALALFWALWKVKMDKANEPVWSDDTYYIGGNNDMHEV